MQPWSIIGQIMPGQFKTPELSTEPGTAGRVLRVTVGVATLFFVTYYQTMQLQGLITSQSPSIPYDMDELVDDIQSGKSKLIMVDPTNAMAEELRTSIDASFTRLRQAVSLNHTLPRFEPDYTLLLQLVLNEYAFWR